MSQNKLNHAIILAAGRGIRMQPLTNSIPKAMAPINGSTLIAKGIKKLTNIFTLAVNLNNFLIININKHLNN